MANKTKEFNTVPVCVTRKELADILHCGIYTSDKIARQAGARMVIGRRVLINMNRINKFLDEETV